MTVEEIMFKSKWPKRTVVVACLLMSGVATQVTYDFNPNGPGFYFRSIASSEDGTESNEQDAQSLLSFEQLQEKSSLLQTEAGQLRKEYLIYFSQIEDRSNSSEKLQEVIDTQHTMLTESFDVIQRNLTDLQNIINDPELISQDVTEEQKSELKLEIADILNDFSQTSEGHEDAIFHPEQFVQEAKIRENTATLVSIKSSLCEQKQEVSKLVNKVEELLADKKEVIEEVEEESPEADIADTTDQVIDYQNYLKGAFLTPMYQYTPFMLNSQSPFDMRIGDQSYFYPSMMNMGFGQGFGHLNTQFSLAPQVVPQMETDYLASYYGTGLRQPSSLPATTFPSTRFSGKSNMTMGNGQDIDLTKLQFGNDFVSNSALNSPSQVMRIPQYSRGSVNSNAINLPFIQ